MTDDVARDRADLDDLSLLRDTPHRERLRRVMDRVAPFGMLRSELADAVFDIESAALAAGVRPAPAAPGLREALDWEEYRRTRGWPTPNHMRRVAGALDTLTPAKYGEVLRWVADACDAALAETPGEPE